MKVPVRPTPSLSKSTRVCVCVCVCVCNKVNQIEILFLIHVPVNLSELNDLCKLCIQIFGARNKKLVSNVVSDDIMNVHLLLYVVVLVLIGCDIML